MLIHTEVMVTRIPDYPLPAWIDADKYWALSEAQRLNALQAMVHMLDATALTSGAPPDSKPSLAGSMGQLRGIPEKPPAFLIKDTWLAAEGRHAELVALEAIAAVAYARITKDERQRGAEIRRKQETCEHVFQKAAPEVRTRICVVCGYVHTLAEGGT